MNAYFQIVNSAGKCAISFYPATDGGEGIRREELLDYLTVKNILYDQKELLPILSGFTEPVTIPTFTDFQRADSDFVKVTISPDNMTVTIREIPPFEGGPLMPKNEFLRELTSRAIAYGVDNDAVDAFLNNRQYCTDVVVARGLPAKQGSDAEIEYYFNTNPRIRPTLNEDGSVDFFNLNTINHCKKGDLLAKLTPAVPGSPGINVKGERIRPRDVRTAVLKYGHNIEVNEDKTELRSMVDGHVSYVEGKVFVANVLEVENVDNSIGNIDYDGSVRVNGNVCENFSVKAGGSVEVRGVVEGAYVEAGQDIIIARGMNGMHKGVLKAGGNVVAKFIENSKVTAGGYVDSETIMHSDISAGTEVHVTGRRGCITGHCTATISITTKNLGSSMGSDTIVEVGVDANVKKRIQELQKEVAEINKQQASIVPVLEGAKQKIAAGQKMLPDQLMQIQKLALLNKANTEKMTACVKELEQYQDIIDVDTNGEVIVTGDVFPGTKICIGDVSMVVKGAMKYCRFIKEAGDVKMAAIY